MTVPIILLVDLTESVMTNVLSFNDITALAPVNMTHSIAGTELTAFGTSTTLTNGGFIFISTYSDNVL